MRWTPRTSARRSQMILPSSCSHYKAFLAELAGPNAETDGESPTEQDVLGLRAYMLIV